MFFSLTEKELDSLREISNIGAGNAVTALHQMTNKTIMLEVPEVSILPFNKVVSKLGGPEEEVIGLFLRIFGDARGNMLIVMSKESSKQLLNIIFNGNFKTFGEMEISALKEIANILTSTYLNAMGNILKKIFVPSIPAFSMDMAQAVVDLLLIELAEVSNNALVIETYFKSRDSSFYGHFFLLPDPASIKIILDTLKSLNF